MFDHCQQEIVRPNDAAAIDVDQLLVEDVSPEQYLAVAAVEGQEVEGRRVEADTVFGDFPDCRGGNVDISPAGAGDQTAYWRVGCHAEAGDEVVDAGDLRALREQDRGIQEARKVELG